MCLQDDAKKKLMELGSGTYQQHSCRVLLTLVRPDHLATVAGELRLYKGDSGGFVVVYDRDSKAAAAAADGPRQPLGCLSLRGLRVEPLGRNKLKLVSRRADVGYSVITYASEEERRVWASLLADGPPAAVCHRGPSLQPISEEELLGR